MMWLHSRLMKRKILLFSKEVGILCMTKLFADSENGYARSRFQSDFFSHSSRRPSAVPFLLRTVWSLPAVETLPEAAQVASLHISPTDSAIPCTGATRRTLRRARRCTAKRNFVFIPTMVPRFVCAGGVAVSTEMTDLEYTKMKATEELEKLKDNAREILLYVEECQAALAKEDATELRKAVRQIDNHVDGYWGRVVMSTGTGEVHGYLQQVEWEQEEREDTQEAA